MLQLAIGSTAVSLGVLLATYMGGLCLGSLALPRLRLRQHPLRVYAALEAGIAILGLVVLGAIPLINRVYVAGAAYGLPGMLLRGFFCVICLLPPTTLMGASLPAIVRWTESTPRGASWWGMLYGGNTAGAVFGCLLAGFYILRIYNMAMGAFAFVRDVEHEYDLAITKDKDYAVVEGANHGFTPCIPCQTTPNQYSNTMKNLFDYAAAWINKRY